MGLANGIRRSWGRALDALVRARTWIQEDDAETQADPRAAASARVPQWLDWPWGRERCRPLWRLLWPIRQLAKDVCEFPATMALIAFWLAMYLIPVSAQAAALGWDSFSPALGLRGDWLHWLGSVSALELRSGEWWRAITACSLHLNVIHLGLNLIGLYFLGRMAEDWYRGPQFLALAVTLGGLGYAASALIRDALGQETVASVGGSGLIFALVGLGAAVGLRERNRFGVLLRVQMLALLAFNLGIGALLPGIDNLAHLMGAAVGFAFGAIDPWLFRRAERPANRWGAVAAILVLLGCQTWQVTIHHAQTERLARLQAERALEARRNHWLAIQEFEAIAARYHYLGSPNPRLDIATEVQWLHTWRVQRFPRKARVWVRPHREEARRLLQRDVARLSELETWLGEDAKPKLDQARALIARTWIKDPTYEEQRQFAESAAWTRQRLAQRFSD